MGFKGLHLVLAIAAILAAASGASALAVSASHGASVTASTCGGPVSTAPRTHVAPLDGTGDDNGTGTNESESGDNETGVVGSADNGTGFENETEDNETGDQNETETNDTGSPDSGASCGTGSPSLDNRSILSIGRDA